MKSNLSLLVLCIIGMLISPNFGNCSDWMEVDGGTISTSDNTFICLGSKGANKIKVDVSGQEGKTSTFIVVDEDNIITTMQKSSNFMFKGAAPGIMTIYNVSYDKKDFNASEGMNKGDVSGTFDMSNGLEVILGTVEAASISLEDGSTTTTVCLNAEEVEPVGVIVEGENEEGSAWIISDKKGVILGLPEGSPIDFSEAGEGTCFIYQVNFIGEISGLEVGKRTKKLVGCYALSNKITINREAPEGGTIEGDSLFFCIGNRSPDKIHGNQARLSGASKPKGQWVITDTAGVILELPKNTHQKDYDDGEPGICLLWHLAYAEGLQGLEVGSNVEDLEGCYDFSNSIVIVKTLANGGHLENGIVKACIEDGEGIFLKEEDFTLTDTAGTNFAWVVTERNKTILGFGDSLSHIDLSESGHDKFFVYFLAYGDDMEGLEVGNRISDLTGCYDFSNQVPVNLEQPVSGELSGSATATSDCGGEGNIIAIDTSSFELTGAGKGSSTWVITDSEGNIIAISEDLDSIDLGESDGSGLVLYHFSSKDATGLEVGENISGIEGCFSISNGIPLEVGGSAEGGTLEGGPFAFCLGEEDVFIEAGAIALSGNSGDTSGWVITDTSGIILGLPTSYEEVNFATAGAGTCFVWNISYSFGIIGLTEGSDIDSLEGCYDFSNGIEVVRDEISGGDLTGGPFSFCIGNGEPAFIPLGELILEGNSGENSGWVVTDSNGIIISLPASIYELDFSENGTGTCLIWNVSYSGEIIGLEVDSSALNLQGCFGLSDSVEVIRTGGDGGVLEGGPFSFCVGDGLGDTIPTDSISLVDNIGANSQWVITTGDGSIILGLPSSPYEVDFDTAGVGVCLVWHLSYEDGLTGLSVDSLVADLEGCFDFSDSLEVFRDAPVGGTIEGGPFGFCTDNPELTELVEGSIILSGNSGMNAQWVITDTSGNILGLPSSPYEVDFVAAGPGECLIWHMSHGDGLAGLEEGNNIENLEGCFALTNSISVFREQADGGELTGGPFEFCVGDGVTDTIPAGAITLSGNAGDTSVWVITDLDGEILSIPASPYEVNFDEAGGGTCLIWHLTFADITGLEAGGFVADLTGCYDFSNAIEVFRAEPDGGMLDGGPFSFCVGDGIPDTIGNEDIMLFDNEGGNHQWVITDTSGNILGLAGNIAEVNFDGSGEGRCLVWNIAYEDGIQGLEVDSLVADLVGCYDLSDSLVVNRSSAVGGSIVLDSLGAVDITFCTDDTSPDLVVPLLSGAAGDSSTWLTTDVNGTILTIDNKGSFDFEGSGDGDVQIWHLSYNEPIAGLEIDSSAANLEGCFSLSNPLSITRLIGEACTSGLVEETIVTMRALQNPVMDQALIDINAEIALGEGTLIVRNIEGEAVLIQPLNIVDDLSQKIALDLEGLQKGMYFVTMKFSGWTETIKLIKQK